MDELVNNYKNFPLQKLTLKEKKANKDRWGKDTINYIDQFYGTGDVAFHSDYKRMLSNYKLYNNELDPEDFKRECNPLGIDVGQIEDEIQPYNKAYNKINRLIGEEAKRGLDHRVILVGEEGVNVRMAEKTRLLHELVDGKIQESLNRLKQAFEQIYAESNPPPQQPAQTETTQPPLPQQEQPAELDAAAMQSQGIPSPPESSQMAGGVPTPLPQPSPMDVSLAEEEQTNQAAAQQQQQVQQQYEQQIQQYNEQKQKEIEAKVSKYMNPAEIEAHLKTTYREAREILVSKILTYLQYLLNIKEVKNDGFKHGLISGLEAVWVGIENDEPKCRIINPLGLVYHKSPEIKYIQNGLFAGHKEYLDAGIIITRYGQDLSKEDYDKLSLRTNYMYNMQAPGKTMDYNHQNKPEAMYRRNEGGTVNEAPEWGSYGVRSLEDIEVFHLEWFSQKKLGFLTTVDPKTGEESEEIVDENTKLNLANGDVSLRWEWVPEVWEGTRIDYDIYVNIRPKPNQHKSAENMYVTKLGYHGVVYNNMNANSISLMDRMKPFQYLYFFTCHKMKKMMAKDRGAILNIDLSMLDPTIGLEKTMYYLDELDINFYNPFANSDDAKGMSRPSLSQGVSRSTMQHVMAYISLMNALDAQIGEVAGITRQSEGQTMASEAVSNVNQNIMQSSYITDIYFSAHSNLWKHVLESLVEVAQVCYAKNPLKAVMVLDDMSMEVLNSEGFDLTNASFGVFLSNSNDDAKRFAKLEALSQSLIQNDKVRLSDIMTMMKAESFEELGKQIKKSEATMDKKQEQAQQSQQESAEKIAQMSQQTEQLKADTLIKVANIQAESRIKAAEINSFSKQLDQDIDDNGVPDQLETEKLKMDVYQKQQKIELDKKRLDFDAKKAGIDIETSREEKVAKDREQTFKEAKETEQLNLQKQKLENDKKKLNSK